MPYVTGADIIAQAAVPNASTEDTAWADLCADALEAVIAHRLEGITPSAGQIDELERAALLDGLAAYAERKAPHGVLSFGPDGDAIRLGRDIVRALEPVLFRIAGPGIG
jgi:hypothetical protein